MNTIIDTNLLSKLPKKHHKYISSIYKEGLRYSVVIRFEDGFTRSIGEYTISDLKYYVKCIIEEDRNLQM